MSERRPAVPLPVKRTVLLEAGHRCAIPTCRHPTTEVAHIVPWSQCKEHEFSNLIALCPNCHTAYDSGQIDRLSIKYYKVNLAVLSGRYGDVERRILDYFAMNPDRHVIYLPGGMEIFVMYLLRDGLLEMGEEHSAGTTSPSSPFTWQTVMGIHYNLTEAGREAVERLAQGRDLSG